MLTTLATVKAELGITGTDDDAYLETLIEQASASIETFCGRSFASASQAQTFRLDRWRERLMLDRTPVASVASVVLNGTTLDGAAVEVESPGAGFLLRVDGNGCSLGWPAGRVVVTYTAGYASTPADVERCCIDLVKLSYFARGRDPVLRSEKILDVIDQSWFDPDKVEMRGGLPADIADRLDAYRMVTIA